MYVCCVRLCFEYNFWNLIFSLYHNFLYFNKETKIRIDWLTAGMICVTLWHCQQFCVSANIIFYYVEIKCQLDATDEFLLQILLLAQHVSGTFMSIIMSSRVLYKWLLSVVIGAWFSSCRCSVELRVVCPVCGLLLYCKQHTIPKTWKPSTKYGRQQPLVWYSRAPDDGHKGARNMLSKQ
jgi:hypothetical protein